MSWWTRSGTRAMAASTRAGSGSTSRKLPPDIHSTSSSPRSTASGISAAVSPAWRGHLEAPGLGEGGGVGLVGREAARERGGVGAHLGAALHPGVAPHRHQAGAVPARRCPRARARFTMPRTPSAALACWVMPIDHSSTADPAPGVLVDERLELHRAEPRVGQQLLEGLLVEGGDELVPPLGVGGDERLVDVPPGDEALQHGVGQGDVTARADRHVEVAHPGAEERRLGARRHPVALEPRLQVGVHHDHAGATASGPRRGTS